MSSTTPDGPDVPYEPDNAATGSPLSRPIDDALAESRGALLGNCSAPAGSIERQFLRAVLDNRGDSSPTAWLLYSGWLAQRGDRRGELIRLWVKLDAAAPDDPDRPRLAEEYRAATEAYDGTLKPFSAWLRQLAAEAGARSYSSHPAGFRWEEGMVRASIPGAVFAKRKADLSDLLGRLPVGGLTVSVADVTELQALARSQMLGDVMNLRVVPSVLFHDDVRENRGADAAAAAFAELVGPDGHVAHLRGFAYEPHDRMGTKDIRALLESPLLQNLRALELRACDIRGGVAALFLRQSPNLRALRIPYNECGEKGAAALASSPDLARLEAVDLGCNDLGPEGVRCLAESPFATGLRVLDLSGNGVERPLDERCISVLLSAMTEETGPLKNLRTLILRDPSLTEKLQKEIGGQLGARVVL